MAITKDRFQPNVLAQFVFTGGTNGQRLIKDSTSADGAAWQSTAGADLIQTGAGTPEAAVVGAIGALYLRNDGGANTTLYVKESGVGNTGWIAK